MKKIYAITNLFMIFLLMGTVSCQKDIVTYDNDYDDQLTSDGPPELNKVSTAANLESAIDEGELTQMIALHGQNLTGVRSILFNDVEVDLKQVYAVRSRITLPIPRQVPGEVSNKITVETDKGTATIPFVVNIPALVVNGLYNEFITEGDTAIITGKYLDLYQLDTLNGVFDVGGTKVKPFRSVEDSVYFVVPENTQEGATIAISSPLVSDPVIFRYRDAGVSILDINSLTSFVTDGTRNGDPVPLPGFEKFLRIHQSYAAWSWNGIFWSGFNLDDADILENPDNYYVKFEINTKSTAAISQGYFILGGDRQELRWNPAENGVLNTYGRWKTMRVELTDWYKDASQANGTYLQSGWNAFVFSYQPTVDVDDDFSICNFRIVRK
jgi:hypothetical protein